MPNDAPPPSRPPQNPLYGIDDAVKRTTTLKSIIQEGAGLFTYAQAAAAVCNRQLSYETFLTLTLGDIHQLADASFAIMVAKIVADKPVLPEQVARAPKIKEDQDN
jgi:hypothetical protein